MNDPLAGQAWIPEASVAELPGPAWELLAERLFDTGAIDAFQIPVVAGRDQQATMVQVVVAGAERDAVEQVLIEQLVTWEIRSWPIERTALAREIVTVSTRWGDVHLALRVWRGRVLDVTPDDDDCAEVARSAGAPFSLIRAEAQRLGDAFVGQRRPGS